MFGSVKVKLDKDLVDKVKKRHVERQITESLQALEVDPRTAVVPFSAELGEGRGPLWAWIEELL